MALVWVARGFATPCDPCTARSVGGIGASIAPIPGPSANERSTPLSTLYLVQTSARNTDLGVSCHRRHAAEVGG